MFRVIHNSREHLGIAALLVMGPWLFGALCGCRGLSKQEFQAGIPSPQSQQPSGPLLEAEKPAEETASRIHADRRVKIHLDLAKAMESRQDAEGALHEYQKALEASEGLSPGHFGRGNAAETKATAHRKMGGALDRMGRFAQAETHYKKALAITPRDSKIWNDMGYSYYLQGKWDDAEKALSRASRLDPQNPKIQMNLGLALAASGEVDRGFETLTQVVGPASAHANIGYILAASGRTEEARRHYTDALRIQPELNQAMIALQKLPLSEPGVPSSASVPQGLVQLPPLPDPALVPARLALGKDATKTPYSSSPTNAR